MREVIVVKRQNTHIDLLRHGEPEGGRMYRGSGTDHPLSMRGWQQMEVAIGDKVDTAEWACIVTSPMLRCVRFAEQLAKKREIPLEVVNDFKEAGYGEWEGKTPAQLIQQNERAYQEFYADPVNCRPCGAEPLATFTQRVSIALEELLERYRGQRILLVSHSGVMRAILSITLNAPLASQQQINIPYAGMYYLLREKRGTRIGIY